ncbi:MAG TPA: hypothetical protein VGM86_16385 [Thermoanaerobaculia bacterium]
MLKSRPYSFLPLLLFACTLVLTRPVFCSPNPLSDPADKKVPSKPTLTPTGPELVLQPNMSQSLHAASRRATHFEWALHGEGKLSTGDGDTALFTAPDHSGAVSLVTVVAHNGEGASPQSSITISTASSPAIRLDAIGIPAGWMSGNPSQNPTRVINLSTSKAGCHTGADCLQLDYRTGAGWAGIVWWPKACGPSGTPDAWRRVKDCSCAVDVLKAGNFRTISKVSFWARGERGGEIVELKVGDDSLCPLPGHSSGLLTLTADWKPYSINLAGLDMRRVVGLFTWVATDSYNPQGATFYLDDIQFEGTR